MSRGLLRNAISNFMGGVIPAAVALCTVPVVISHLGAVQYGIFVLLTSVVGYFAMLDINVSAGSMKYLAEYHAQGDQRRASEVISCGAIIYLLIGCVGGAGLFGSAAWVLSRFFDVPSEYQTDTIHALQIGAAAFLFGQMQAYLTSVPQALLRYDISGRYESIFGVLVSVATMIVVLVGGDLAEIMAVRLALSVLNCGFLAVAIRRLMPQLQLCVPPRSMVSAVLSFSGYAYLNRVAAVTYQNADKLIVGSVLDMRAVAFFSVPFVLTNRVFSMVFRLGHALFPLTSALASQGKDAQLRATYLLATRYVLYLNGCLCVTLCMLSREILHYWAGHEFGLQAAQVLQIVSIAAFIDSSTNLPSLVNDGLGKPRNTGVFAVIRALLCVVLVSVLVRRYGLVGAAWGQLATSSVVAIAFLIYIHGRTVPVAFRTTVREAYIPTLVILALFLPIAFFRSDASPSSLQIVGALTAAIVVVLLLVGWRWVLNDEARALVIERLIPRGQKFIGG